MEYDETDERTVSGRVRVVVAVDQYGRRRAIAFEASREPPVGADDWLYPGAPTSDHGWVDGLLRWEAEHPESKAGSWLDGLHGCPTTPGVWRLTVQFVEEFNEYHADRPVVTHFEF